MKAFLITYWGGTLPKGTIALLDGVSSGPGKATSQSIARTLARIRADGYTAQVQYGAAAKRALMRLKKKKAAT